MNIKKVLILIFSICLIISNVFFTFSLNFTTVGLDESLLHTYLAEDESKDPEIEAICNNFLDNFINDNMSPLEKEIQIIKYLVETISYDDGSESNTLSPDAGDVYSAYAALVRKKCVCSGYAKAFDILAKKSGLTSTVVTGTAKNQDEEGPHAWNQIELDNEWYNVDVTWEDPVSSKENYGFNKLRNEYINRTDEFFSKTHVRETGHDCTATKYGKEIVAIYLNTGNINPNIDMDEYRLGILKQISIYSDLKKENEMQSEIDKLLLVGARYDNNANYFPTADNSKINSYILQCINNGQNAVAIVTIPDTHGKLTIDQNGWLEENLKRNATVHMNNHYISDGSIETRVIIFNFS